MRIGRLGNGVVLALITAAIVAAAPDASAQSRVGSDSATRLTRLGRAVAYGSIIGAGYTAVDQWQNDPPQWGKGWPGFGKRLASNLGEFYIQEGVTEGLAAVMNRPLDYTPCKCTAIGDRVLWGIQGAVVDELPNGKRVVAVPRIVGAYVGSFAQALWRPGGQGNRLNTALVNGTTSLGISALINMYYEFRHHPEKASTMAGERK